MSAFVVSPPLVKWYVSRIANLNMTLTTRLNQSCLSDRLIDTVMSLFIHHLC